MKIEHRPATGCPYGQFVVFAENSQERAVLANFIHARTDDPKWRFHIHGYGCDVRPGGYDGLDNFNFGYADGEKWERNSRKPSLLRRLIAFTKKLIAKKVQSSGVQEYKNSEFEQVVLDDTLVSIFVPRAVDMIHVNFDIPHMTIGGRKYNRRNALRQIYRRTDRLEDGLPVFEHCSMEDR